jgi:hypothetical protein
MDNLNLNAASVRNTGCKVHKRVRSEPFPNPSARSALAVFLPIAQSVRQPGIKPSTSRVKRWIPQNIPYSRPQTNCATRDDSYIIMILLLTIITDNLYLYARVVAAKTLWNPAPHVIWEREL